MSSLAERFAELHRAETPLLLPNPWDVGTARLFASLGFSALATTSSGHAATLGRLDGRVSRDEALMHAAAIVRATPLPVSADLENGFGHDPETVAETVRLAVETGVAGCSIEDYSQDPAAPFYPADLAAERVAAAAEAAHGGPHRLVLSARAENDIRNRDDLANTIARLQSFQEAGADVLYAPQVSQSEHIRQVVAAVDRPVNVLVRPGCPPVAELAEMGVARVSIGGTFSLVGLAAVADAAMEFLDEGTYGFLGRAAGGRGVRDAAFAYHTV